MVLKSQDVLVMLKLVALGDWRWTYSSLATDLHLSPSQLHSAVRRAVRAQLAIKDGNGARPHFRNLEEFLVHGVRYVFVPERGEPTRGLPTGYAGPPLSKAFDASNELPPVWPDPEGEVRGMAFSPLYKNAVAAARRDGQLYELLALVDAIRGGRARERDMAVKALRNRLAQHA